MKIETNDDEPLIEVIDSGSGFTEEDLKNVLNFLYTGNLSRKNDKHYGIGLYQVNEVVRAHGGEISIENNEDGNGARVKILMNN